MNVLLNVLITLAIFFLMPLAVIWGLNVLFHLSLDYTWTNYFAVLAIRWVFRGQLKFDV